MLHQRTSCSGLHRQQHTARPTTTSGARDRCRPVSSSGHALYLGPLPTAGTRRCSTSAQRRGKPSVRVASASTDSGDDLQTSTSWRREAAKAVAVALPAPLHDLWAGLLQLLGLQNNSDYEFRIYKSEVQQPPPAVTQTGATAENEQIQAIASARPSEAAAPELSVSASADAASAPAAATSTAAWDDLVRIRKLSLPLMAQNVFEYLMTVVCTISIGHLGAAELAASSLANSVYIVSGLSLALGLSSAMETLCGQAYGAKEYKTLGHVLQRALLVCWVACIPVGLLWTHSTALMLAVGQTPAVAAMAGRYLTLCIPCIFLNIGTDCMKKYLQAQHIVSPGMYANAASTFLAPLYFWVLVTKMGLGLDGAAIAFILCQLTSFLGVGAYIAWHAKKNEGSKTSTWGGFSASAAFSKWWQYLQYGIPAMLMISLEWWVYQIPIVMIGWLPNPQAALGVGGICVAFNGWGYMCALGLSQAVNTLVSNALGAGDAQGAKRATVLGVACMVILQTGMMATMLLGGETLVRFISTDALVVSLALKTLPVLCGVMLMDGLNTVLYSVVRASGEQAAGSLISGSYLVVATALTYGINFMLPPHILQHLPLLGSMEPVARIWMGVVLGAVCQFAVLATYIWKFDWKEQAQRATQRAVAVGGH